MSMTASGVTGSWSYGYDAGNRLVSTSNPYGETATNVFDAANRLTSTTMGNGSVSTFGYDNANRTTSIVHSTSGSATLASYQYSYDSVSNVSTRTDSDGTVTTFGYDASDQLTSESRDNSHGTGYSIALAYDHNGNRSSSVQNGVTTSYSYDHHDKLQSAGSKSYGYDSNGNCTSVSVGTSVTTLTYDIENRVVGISYPGGASNSFAYNGEDLRTQKVDSGRTQNYVTDGSSPASAVLKDGNAVYTPGLSERRGSASKFYHGDALGSTRGITDSSQSVTDSQLYDAFGNTLSRTGSTPTPFGFVGKAQYQSDSDSGLQLLGHRYYDPSIGRFLSRDPAKAGTNWYAYCENNPLSKVDPLGLAPPVPDAPPGVSVDKNIKEAQSMLNTLETLDALGQIAGTLLGGAAGYDPSVGNSLIDLASQSEKFDWFYHQVRNKSPWDYKQQNKKHPGHNYADFGNFNYGATGTALGIDEITLLKAAGAAQIAAGTSTPGWGNPLTGPPYGDDPADQKMIKNGIEYFKKHFKK